MIAGFGIFRKTADQIFKDVAHLHVVDGLRVQIEFRKGLDHGEEAVVLVHLRNLLAKVQTARFGEQDFLHVRGKAFDVADEIRCQMVRIIAKFAQRETARIVELEACRFAQCLRRVIRILVVEGQDLILRRCQGAFKTADNGHGDNDFLVFIALIGAAQLIGNGPNHTRFFRYIHRGIVPHGINYLTFRHSVISPFSRSYALIVSFSTFKNRAVHRIRCGTPIMASPTHRPPAVGYFSIAHMRF